VPALLSPEDVERVLAAPDRSTTRRRCDCAILLLLARLGLRASEIVSIELHEDRGTSASPRVFLRLIPPRVGLARPCAIDHVVRRALTRAP